MSQKCDSHEYTETEQETWILFFKEIEKIWEKYAKIIHPYYLDHVQKLYSFTNRIPSLSDINELLAPIGWRSIYVDGYAPPWEISKLYDQKILAISKSIRTPEEVHFANEPDLIHDFFGHLPCLFSSEYRNLLSIWSHLACKSPVYEIDQTYYYLNKLIAQSEAHIPEKFLTYLKNATREIGYFITNMPSPVLMFDHAYFWIFEFGIIKQQDDMKVLGAGLLSSLNELEKLTLGSFSAHDLDSQSVLSSYHISVQQDRYLVVSNIDQYQSILGDFSKIGRI
jgi:phenylalanine-4-hydroxylase